MANKKFYALAGNAAQKLSEQVIGMFIKMIFVNNIQIIFIF